MIRDLKISEYQAIITHRVLLDALPNRPVSYERVLVAVKHTVKTMLREMDAHKELDCIITGRGDKKRRLYLIHKRTFRIAAELGIDSEQAERGKCKRVKVHVLGRGGKRIPGTIGDMIIAADKLGKRYFNKPMKGENHGRNYQSQTK